MADKAKKATKCTWCAKETPDLEEIELTSRGQTEKLAVCGSDCENQLREFGQQVDKNVGPFLGGLIMFPMLGVVLTFAMLKIDRGGLGCLVIFAGIGLVLYKYPFVTPQTIKMFGAQKGIKIGRISGIVCIIVGVLAWLGLWLGPYLV